MMLSKIRFSILVVVIGVFGLSTGGYGQERVCKIAELVELKNGEAEREIQQVDEVDILRYSADRERVQQGVRAGQDVPFRRIVDCKSGANLALRTDSDAKVWLNYKTAVGVVPGTIELLDRGQIYIEEPGTTAFELGNALSISSSLASSLDRGEIPGELRQALGKVGITLSPDAVVSVEGKDLWLVKDGDQKHTVRRDRINKARLNISLNVRSDGTEFFLKALDEKEPAIIYLFKGRIGVGSHTLDKKSPAAAISNTGEIEVFPFNAIPKNIENNLFRARLWRNSIKRITLPFWRKPNFYVPATALAAVGAGVTIYRYAKGKGSKDSRLNVFVDPWERRR